MPDSAAHFAEYGLRRLIGSTPLGLPLQLLDLFGVTTKLPGLQKQGAEVAIAIAKRRRKSRLDVGFLQDVLTGKAAGHGLSNKRLAAVLANPALWKPGAREEALMLLGGGGTGGLSMGGGGGFDWGGLATGVANATFGYLNTKAQTKQLKQLNRLMMMRSGITPSGSAIGFAGVPAAAGGGWDIGSILAGAGAASLGLPSLGGITDVLPGGLEEGGTGLFGPDLFAPTAASSRQRMLDAEHPSTGERVFWRPVGRPILFAGDLALLKRTRKVIGRFATRSGLGGGPRRRTFRRRR